VLKPDVGERGRDVAIVHDEPQARAYLEAHSAATLAQEFVPGPEFGISYHRLPGQDRGRIHSITRKRIPTVTGDGATPLIDLILADRRAVCMAARYLAENEERLHDVPAAGALVPIARIGNHRLGCIFEDGRDLRTDALESTVDAIARTYEGFWIGRFDVRAESVAALQAGRGFKIVELNGLTAEPAHIYDPAAVTLRDAYRALCEHYRIAFEIGRLNAAAGAPRASLLQVLRAWTG
jgi:hypothetical protein